VSPTPDIVSVAFPNAISGLYDYRVPPRLAGRVVEGSPVLVDVRSRRLWGMAVRLGARSEYPSLKEVLDVKDVAHPETFRSHIAFYEWIAEYYQCALGTVFRPFVRKGLAQSQPREVTYYRLGQPAAGTALTARQQSALGSLAGLAAPVTRAELRQRHGLSDHMVDALCRAGALQAQRTAVVREADELRAPAQRRAVTLTGEQQQALERLAAALPSPQRPFLLHGITGSGKTHVYIELVKRCLASGRGAVVLVPEISLTPQTIQRFAGEIGDTISVIHSHMSDGERSDSLRELMAGRRRVVIGVRSAVLAPLPDLGLIVVDEEHDQSYKQSDTDPRYHARDVAIVRGKLQGALVVLGSATPSLESWRNAQQGKYELLRLRSRFGDAALPRVELVDMNAEHRAGNWKLLSRHLQQRLDETLAAGRQAILLLNRRGFSTFLLCKTCGFIHACPNCSVNLVYHRAGALLLCHQCGHTAPAPSVCPKCRGENIQYKGSGIQKAEELLRETFPRARIVRMDQDTTRRKGAHVSILQAVERRETDILLGTQMVAKGLDFPGVALVGVLQADTSLHVPDFRAAERTFQLLAQVAGRAGRTDDLGEVIVQTYLPADPSITAARDHDYERFAGQELPHREELAYPPFCRLARILVWGPDNTQARGLADSIAATLRQGNPQCTILGPAPAVVERIKSAWRHSLLVKAASARALQEALSRVRQAHAAVRRKGRCAFLVDVDPVNML